MTLEKIIKKFESDEDLLDHTETLEEDKYEEEDDDLDDPDDDEAFSRRWYGE